MLLRCGVSKLAVDQPPSIVCHYGRQVDEGEFACTRHEREHALPEEGVADADSVKSAHKPIAVPCLHACCKTLMVELCICLYDVLPKPCPLMLYAELAALGDDAIKILVYAEAVSSFVDERTHGVGDMYLLREDYETIHGAVPHRLVAVAEGIPGEDAVAVGKQQAVGGEIAAYCEKTVGFAETWVWKRYLLVKCKYHSYVWNGFMECGLWLRGGDTEILEVSASRSLEYVESKRVDCGIHMVEDICHDMLVFHPFRRAGEEIQLYGES